MKNSNQSKLFVTGDRIKCNMNISRNNITMMSTIDMLQNPLTKLFIETNFIALKVFSEFEFCILPRLFVFYNFSPLLPTFSIS